MTIRSTGPAMSPCVPTIDLARWQDGPPSERAAVGERLDEALRRTGMFLLRSHGVPREVVEELRRRAREFFALPREVKARYAVEAACDGGWLGMHPPGGVGVEIDDGQVSGAPDLHESFYAGPGHRTGTPDRDRVNYPANRWPAELPELRTAVEVYTGCLLRVARAVNELLAVTLGLPADFFTARAERATWTQNLSLYPSLNAVGGVAAGQFRNGPHTDLGTFTVLSRQPGVGCLQGHDDHAGWFAPPHDPDSFIVNLGDLMELWTDGRWRALRHRVLPPSPSAPDEELLSLVFFFETDPDTIIEPLPAPMGGGRGLAPARARQTVLDKLGVATGGEDGR
ncbi:MAG TPA: 2-oxoglutarate and iron-dependent oxygenase domain-containing protein [Trebonia sp.]|jgi:isopenicillin N synthase-like dioxygenase|nr:2-oxoglutarate and iron-dependent oxygenase domain-containing protein [Trebonia sp.]